MQMTKRISIMIDDDLDKKLRQRQAKKIIQEQTSYSYSKVLNEALRKVLK
jgi:predicted transcriptional regulator